MNAIWNAQVNAENSTVDYVASIRDGKVGG